MENSDSGIDEALTWYVRRFEETKNAYYAAEAFLIAAQAQLETPKPILAWLADGFQQWSAKDGQADLGQLLSLKPGRGQESISARLNRERRNDRLMGHMDVLMHLGATREQAAVLAHEEAKDAPLIPSVDTLISMHARRKKEAVEDWKEIRMCDRQWRSNFLARFDAQYMPSRLKSML